MSDSIAVNELKSYVRRIEAVEDRIKVENEDKSEIYKEARANGYDVKVLRQVIAKRRKDATKRSEEDAIFDIYWQAIHGVASARVENIEEFDAETGEITEPQSAPQAAQSQSDALLAVAGIASDVTSPDRREGDNDGQPIQPETVKLLGTVSDAMQTDIGRAALLTALDVMIEREEADETTPGASSNGDDGAAEGFGKVGARAGGATPPTGSIYTFTPKPHDGPFSSNGLPRPKGCQHVDACGGTWRGLCASCERALADQSEPETAA